MKEHMQAITSDNIMMGLLLNQKDTHSWKTTLKSLGSSQIEGRILSLWLSPAKDRNVFYSLIVTRLKDTCCLYSIIHHDILYCLILSDHGIPKRNTSCEIPGHYNITNQTDVSAEKFHTDFNQEQLLNIIQHLALEYDLTYTAGISSAKTQPEQFSQAIFEADTARKNAHENSCRHYTCIAQTARKDYFGPFSEMLAKMLESDGPEKALDFFMGRLQNCSFTDNLTFADQYFSEKMIIRIASLLKMDKRRTGMKWTIQNRIADMKNFHLQNGRSLGENDDLSITNNIMKMNQWILHLKEELYQLSQDLTLPVRKSSSYVELALHRMNCRYMEDFSLDQLAADVGITQFYLSRLLKQERNQTFMEILTDIRINHALELMTDPSQSVQSISQSVGYTTKYFYQIFRNTMGISQKAFRDALFI